MSKFQILYKLGTGSGSSSQEEDVSACCVYNILMPAVIVGNCCHK